MSDKHKVNVYKDANDEWRWHRKAANGEIVVDSGEGYNNLVDALDMAQRINQNVDWEVNGEPLEEAKDE